jgi:hypothetical protein
MQQVEFSLTAQLKRVKGSHQDYHRDLAQFEQRADNAAG